MHEMHEDMAGGKKEKGKLASKLAMVYGNPYSVRKRGSQFVVINTKSGSVKGAHASKEKAMRQFRLLEMVAHGGKPRNR